MIYRLFYMFAKTRFYFTLEIYWLAFSIPVCMHISTKVITDPVFRFPLFNSSSLTVFDKRNEWNVSGINHMRNPTGKRKFLSLPSPFWKNDACCTFSIRFLNWRHLEVCNVECWFDRHKTFLGWLDQAIDQIDKENRD